MEDFGIPSSNYSEQQRGKIVRLKAKALSAFFWFIGDVVKRYNNNNWSVYVKIEKF